MRSTIRNPLLALVLLGASAACASGAGDARPSARYAERVGTVQVTNDGHEDFVLYMVRDGVRYRLGRVARMETARFRIPGADLGPRPSYQVHLVGEPVGTAGRTFSTGIINWRPGQNLDGRVSRSVVSQQFVVVTH